MAKDVAAAAVSTFSTFSFGSTGGQRSEPGEAEGTSGARRIEVGIPNYIPDDEYCSNAIITAKYNVLTFLPVFLFKVRPQNTHNTHTRHFSHTSC